MLQEKYDALNDRKFQAIVRCRRCGSEEVTWDEKQTRSADEGATVFCACQTCKNRWVMR
jgi:DNA-directed RNA polymerase subunit M/transcription elongation factor TFIIS